MRALLIIALMTSVLAVGTDFLAVACWATAALIFHHIAREVRSTRSA